MTDHLIDMHRHPHRSDRVSLVHATIVFVLLVGAVLFGVAGVTVVIYGGLL